MISIIIDALREDEHFGAGECTEIAKGKYELTTSWREGLYKFKRKRKCLAYTK